METPETLGPPEDTPTESHQSQEGNTDNTCEDASHGVVGMVPGSNGKMRPRRPRGRHAKDPLAKSIMISCQRLEDLEAALKQQLADPAIDREHTTLEFDFPVTAAFMVAAREATNKGDLNDKKTPYIYSPFNKTAITVVDALHTIKDPKERAIMQKGISKTLVEACQNTPDCNDSVLNKGRAANEGVSKMKAGVKVRKPVYDCHGLISVKFSVTKDSLELHYKHIPLHKTFEERAPNPRNGSKRKRLLEIFHPEKLVRPKRRKSSAPKPKKPAAEPVAHVDEESTTLPRENSLAPLFDFLGRVDEDRAGPNTSEAPTVKVDSANTPTSGDGNNRKKKVIPGTFTWTLADSQKEKRRSRKKAPVASEAPVAPPPLAATAASPPTMPPAMPQSSSQTVTPVSSTELELRARLEQAEQKIRDLEQRQERGLAEPGRLTPLQYQGQQGPLPPAPAALYPPRPPPPPPPPPHAYFPPPQFQHPSHSVQWNYGPPPYPYPYPLPGQPGLSYPNHAPGSAPAATHPHAYHYPPPQSLPPPSQQRPRSNPPPAYGFVPNPLDPLDSLTTRIRSHLGPPQSPATPGSSSGSRVEPRVGMQSAPQTPLSSVAERQSGTSSCEPPATVPGLSGETAAEPTHPTSEGETMQEPNSTSTTTAEQRAAEPDPGPTESSDKK
ncbi:hypothetical protein FOPE_09349 [Fonsecaea pedrosoi]|nr:hypothetical protein FOPE_09349 [Fonsecaea pedrosoi]